MLEVREFPKENAHLIQSSHIQQLISDLHSKDGMVRQKARHSLVRMGTLVTPFLLQTIYDPNAYARWEAAMILRDVRDPTAASALVDALMDESDEIQWIAAEALIALKTHALIPLLEKLQTHADSLSLQQGAHHVMHALERETLLEEPFVSVLNALRSIDPELAIQIAVNHALKVCGRSTDESV